MYTRIQSDFKNKARNDEHEFSGEAGERARYEL